MVGCGWLWLVVVGCSWLWLVVVTCGSLWLVAVGCGCTVGSSWLVGWSVGCLVSWLHGWTVGWCEEDGDVAGVVTPLRGVGQVVLHGVVQVVEEGELLRENQHRVVEEDGDGQVEVPREEGEHLEPMRCV